MTILEVVRRTTEEDRFYVDVDLDNVDVGKFIGTSIEDPKELSQLKNLLAKANCEDKVTRSVKNASWYFNSAENVPRTKVAGKLAVLKKYYARVKLNVTHSITLLFEVNSEKYNNVPSILNDNIDSELGDILKEKSMAMFVNKNITDSDWEVLDWADDITNLSFDNEAHCETAIRIYTQED